MGNDRVTTSHGLTAKYRFHRIEVNITVFIYNTVPIDTGPLCITLRLVTSDGKYNTSTEKRAIAALQCHSVNVMEKVTSPTSIY